MFDNIVLICAIGMEPQECQPPTAVDQVFLSSVPNEIRCGMDGEEHLAQAASLVKPGYFIKITCVRREDERSDVRACHRCRSAWGHDHGPGGDQEDEKTSIIAAWGHDHGPGDVDNRRRV